MRQRLDLSTEEGRRFVFGLLLIAGGILLLASRLDIFHVFRLWPLVFVGLGLAKISGACCSRQRRNGTWLLVLGLWFSLNQFTDFGYRHTWPLILVAVGGMMAWDAVSEPGTCPRCAEGRHGQ